MLTMLFVVGCAETPYAGGDLDAFLREVRRTQRDYEPTSGPTELAELADLTVVGQIVDASPGQLYAPLPSEPAMIASTVLTVSVAEVLSGDDSLVQDGMIYVEVAHPAFFGSTPEVPPDVSGYEPVLEPYDTLSFAASVPRSRGVFFLGERTNDPYWESVINAGAGRPEGARLFATYTEGFILEAATGEAIGVYVALEELESAWRDVSSIQDLQDLFD